MSLEVIGVQKFYLLWRYDYWYSTVGCSSQVLKPIGSFVQKSIVVFA